MKGISFLIKHVLVVSTLFFSCLFMTGCHEKKTDTAKEPQLVKAMQIKPQQQGTSRAFPGLAKATQEVNLAFDVNGTLIERPISNGIKVQKGQLIARLDPRDFEANLRSAKSQLENDSRNLARGKELIKKQFISQMELDQLQTKFDVAKSKYELAEKALNDTVLRAPFVGEIATSYVENFQAVQAKQPIARLLDISSIEMDINIPETLISRAKEVKQLEVTFDAFPQHPISATVKEASGEASPTTRTYKATLSMKQPKDITILPGMAGSAVVAGVQAAEKTEGHIIIPPQAIFTSPDNTQQYVWVIDPKTQTVSRREIKLGAANTTGIAIASGLKSGEWIVIAGVNTLHQDEKVKILDQSKG